MELQLGQKVIVKKGEWDWSDGIMKKIDVEGVVTSIAGVSPEHNNLNKYQITTKRCRHYTNNLNDELSLTPAKTFN